MRKSAHKSSWSYYGVKLIYQMSVTGNPIPEYIDEDYSDTHTFFEESIILVRAQSFDHAYKVAEREAKEVEETKTNLYGQVVEKKLIDAIDCFLIGDELANRIEIYSSITPAKKEITPGEYLMRKYEYNLEDYDWNTEQIENKIVLQKVLIENFSLLFKDSNQ